MAPSRIHGIVSQAGARGVPGLSKQPLCLRAAEGAAKVRHVLTGTFLKD